MDKKVSPPSDTEFEDLQRRVKTLEKQVEQLKHICDIATGELALHQQHLREVNYYLQNSLVPVIGLLYMKRRRAVIKGMTASQNELATLVSQVSVVSVAYRLFADYDWGLIPLSVLTQRVVRETLQTVPTPTKLSLVVEESPVNITVEQARNLALILNELTLNTIKFACAKGGGHIVVTIVDNEKEVRLEFHDSGPGYPDAVLSLKDEVALYLIHMLTHSLPDGNLSIYNRGGAVSIIRFSRTAKQETASSA